MKNLSFIAGAIIYLSLGLFPTVSQAFILHCEADTSSHIILGGKTTLECEEHKTKTTFTTNEFEIGPGLRFTIFSEDPVAKYVKVVCPFMKAKKLEKMKSGDSFNLGGIVADADILVGARIGLNFGKPGICFIAGGSAFELGAEVALHGIQITKE